MEYYSALRQDVQMPELAARPAWRVKMRIKVFEDNKCYYVKSLIEYLPYSLSVRRTVCHSGIRVCVCCVCNQFA